MSGLIADLSGAAQSLATQSKGLEIAGKNLANVNTDGYSRQRVNLSAIGDSSLPPNAQAIGVQATGIEQVRDSILDAQVTRATSQTSFLQTQSDNLTKAQTYLGEQVDTANGATSINDTGSDTSGISSALTSFFNAFDNLAASPTDPLAKQTVFQTATDLSNKFNAADSQLQTLQGDITTQTGNSVTTVNGLLNSIAQLNGQIAQTEISSPNSSADLVDARQSKLEQLAQYMNFSVNNVPNGNGQIQVVSNDASGNPVVLVDKTAVPGGGISFDGTNFTGGYPSATLSLQGGSLAGGIAVRDGAIQQLRDNLKTTATQLASAVNAAYNPTSATGNFFQGNPSSGILALDSSVTSNSIKTTDTGNAGANELALGVAQVANHIFSTSGGDAINGTISDFYSQTVTGFGQTVSTTETDLSDQQTVQSMLQTQRDSVSGVSQDEELANLMKFQRAYQASAHVVNILNDLMGIVVSGFTQST